MNFPKLRLRRLRENPLVRGLVTETRLDPRQLVYPLFVKEKISKKMEVVSMPGQFQWPVSEVAEEAERASAIGVRAVLLFGIPAHKDLSGREAARARGAVQKAVRSIKKRCRELLVITDVCLCEYLAHGHCGLTDRRKKEEGRWKKGIRVRNDATVKVLAEAALSHAEAGADVVAPSDMMDGRVQAIRKKLDGRGFRDTPILSYAVKYASAFYAPFRDAAESSPRFGDRKSYQMNPANKHEALREARTDLEEGADMLLVKPALAYQDVLSAVKQKFDCPVGAYSVSGEYAMVKAAAQKGWLDEKKTVLETHLGFKRAGADFIVTYWAKDLAKWHRA